MVMRAAGLTAADGSCLDDSTTVPQQLESRKASEVELASAGGLIRRVVRSAPGGWLRYIVGSLTEIDDTPGRDFGRVRHLFHGLATMDFLEPHGCIALADSRCGPSS